MKKNIVCLMFLISLCLNTSAFGADGDSLIPRKVFFTAKGNAIIGLSPSGDKLYYLDNNKENTLYICSTNDRDSVRHITLNENTASIQPVNEGVLLIDQDSLATLSFKGNDGIEAAVHLPVTVKSIKLLRRSDAKPNVWAVALIGINDKESGIYTLDIKTNASEKICRYFPDTTLFFDGNLNIVAGNTSSGKLMGNSLLLYDKNKKEWSQLLVHEYNEDMLGLGGVSKVVSVSSDGNTVYFTSNKFSDKSRLYAYHKNSGSMDTLARHTLVDLLPFGSTTDTDGNVTSVVGLFAKAVCLPLTRPIIVFSLI